MEKNCKSCKNFFKCDLSKFLPFPENGCSDFVYAKKTKTFVLVHVYVETGFRSIVCFSDSRDDLVDVMESHPRFGSSRHQFIIAPNLLFDSIMTSLKDECLINICKNVAEYLSVGEYAMLKKSYFKSLAWFEKAKNSCSLGADILENY